MRLKNLILILLAALSSLLALTLFLFSCIVTLSDGQGVFVFIFSLPIIGILLSLSWFLSARWTSSFPGRSVFIFLPRGIFGGILVFFVLMMVPGLNLIPSGFLSFVGKSFESVTGKSPYVYFRERKSFPVLLENKLNQEPIQTLNLSDLDVTYAWDEICIFGPYTNNEKAKSVLKLEWNIEDFSDIASSDSVNALVFLYQGKVNKVVDLKRSLVDFDDLDRCSLREKTQFEIRRNDSNRRILRPHGETI